MEIFGKNPVAWPALILGKIALVTCVLFFPLKIWIPEAMLFDSSVTRVLGSILYAVGMVLLGTAIAQLGESTKVGLPEGATSLKTHGLYRYSRNPIYASGYLVCAGSCLFAIHPVNLLCFFITIAIHHRIILREEDFLQNRFGRRWVDYKDKVKRYI